MAETKSYDFDYAVDRLVKQYHSINPDYPSCWVMMSQPRDQMTFHEQQICHADMRYKKADLWDEMINAYPVRRDVDLEYIQWLLTGPFWCLQDQVKLKERGDKYYLHVLDLDKVPANVLFNFLITARMPVECPNVLSIWSTIKDLGLDAGPAFVIAAMAGDTDEKLTLDSKLSCGGPRHHGHWPFQMHHDWRRFARYDPNTTKFSQSYRSAPHECTPADCIWGFGSSAENYALFEHTLGEIKEMFTQ